MNDINETAENGEYQQIFDMGSVTTSSDGGTIHCLTIVGYMVIVDSDSG